MVSNHLGVPRLGAAIRAVLLEMVDEGRLRELDSDYFERIDAAAELLGLDWPFEIGEETTRKEIAEVLQQRGAAGLGRGMFKPADGKPFSDHVLLFHDPFNNPYGDEIAGDHISYVGEGKVELGDQTLTRNNRHLAEQLEKGYQVHFFVRANEHGSTQRYMGPVVVQDVREVYRPDEGRVILQFDLVRLTDAPDRDIRSSYSRALLGMHDDERPPGYEARKSRRTLVQRIIRDRAFRQLVLGAYGEVCAVCGEPLRHGGLSELEAAHIVPVADRGRDHVQNGLSLCKRHHWAFDHGLFCVDRDLSVAVIMDGEDPHAELVDGAGLVLPQEARFWPHEFYLEHHRQKWRPRDRKADAR